MLIAARNVRVGEQGVAQLRAPAIAARDATNTVDVNRLPTSVVAKRAGHQQTLTLYGGDRVRCDWCGGAISAWMTNGAQKGDARDADVAEIIVLRRRFDAVEAMSISSSSQHRRRTLALPAPAAPVAPARTRSVGDDLTMAVLRRCSQSSSPRASSFFT